MTLFAARGKRGDLSYLPQPSKPVTGSPFTVTTSQNIGPFEAGAVLITVQGSLAHMRVFRAGETPVAATTGDMGMTQIANFGPHVVPTRKDDFITMVSTASSTVQISQASVG